MLHYAIFGDGPDGLAYSHTKQRLFILLLVPPCGSFLFDIAVIKLTSRERLTTHIVFTYIHILSILYT